MKLKAGFVRHKGEEVRFLTLTSPKAEEQVGDLGKAWNKFATQIGRVTIRQLIKDGYIKPRTYNRFFKDRNLDESLKLEYCKVETREGNGVLHIICVGDYLPVKWLRDMWKKYRGAVQMKIKLAKNPVYDANRLAVYCVNQYVAGQDMFVRSSCSKNWCFPGFVESWEWVKVECARYVPTEEYGQSVQTAIKLFDASIALGMHPVTLEPLGKKKYELPAHSHVCGVCKCVIGRNNPVCACVFTFSKMGHFRDL
ncbi:MAG: hypothetical protein GY845_28650 [Planctomycetes bacterium]|nr:hypothetical protein [Planctomycetota bacterium]